MLGGKQGLEMRQMPEASRAYRQERLYYVWRYGPPELPKECYEFRIIFRDVRELRNAIGLFARCKHHWRRVYSSDALPGFLKEIRDRAASTTGAFRNGRFNKKIDEFLPFVKDWERPVGRYYTNSKDFQPPSCPALCRASTRRSCFHPLARG
jgi:hypothetical protein